MIIPKPILEVGMSTNSPTYVYDLERVRARCRDLEAVPVKKKSIYFATMANDHPAVLSCIAQQGHGVFVNSLKHLKLVLDLGFNTSQIVYAASNMVANEMQSCVDCGVHLVLDSISQIESLGKITEETIDVGIRVNVGSTLDGEAIRHDPFYRFGILPDELSDAVSAGQRHGIRVVGVHCYFGTDVMDKNVLLDGLRNLFQIAGALPDLRYVDGGGGFGVSDMGDDATCDVAAWGKGAAEILHRQELHLGRSIELFIEPGRYMVADSGLFFVRVVDLKMRADRVFVGTNGSVSMFPRLLHYPETARHPCQVAGTTKEQHPLPIYICGNSTYSRDFLARAVRLPLPEVGNLIVFGNAGAYCRSMFSDFLGKERPTEIILDTANIATNKTDEFVMESIATTKL